jgi:hypothetical protein
MAKKCKKLFKYSKQHKSIDCKPLFLGVYGLGFHNLGFSINQFFIGVHMTIEKRSIRSIALDIRKEWAKVNYAAKPYLDAMMELNSINDRYYDDSAKSVVLYFLSNASSFRGERAKALKAELKALGA